MSAKPIRKRVQTKWKAHPHLWRTRAATSPPPPCTTPTPHSITASCPLAVLTFGRRLWPRVKTLLNFQLSPRRHSKLPSTGKYYKHIHIYIYDVYVYVHVCVCVCIYCFLINQTKSERGSSTQRRKGRYFFACSGQGWPGSSIHFIHSYWKRRSALGK